MSGQEAIQVQALTKRYGARTVVDSLHLTVHAGECFALLGVNGAGKNNHSNVVRPDASHVRGCMAMRTQHSDRFARRAIVHRRITAGNSRCAASDRSGEPVVDERIVRNSPCGADQMC